MARDQRLVAVEEQIVGFRAVAAADDVHVASAARDDQSGLGALALDQRVDRCRRAVDQFTNDAGVETALADAVEDALRQFMGRCEALGLDETTDLVVKANKVGECPPDIDCYCYHRGRTLLVFSPNTTLSDRQYPR